jgi:hypothetical protein
MVWDIMPSQIIQVSRCVCVRVCVCVCVCTEYTPTITENNL